MSFRSRETLERWLADFQALSYPLDRTVRVIEQDGAGGANTGLVAVELSSGMSAYIQPSASGAWVVTLDTGEVAEELAPAQVARLSTEISTVSALCAFLQAKSSIAAA